MAQLTLPKKLFTQPLVWLPKQGQWRWSTALLYGGALLVMGLMLLTPLYLVLRTAEAGEKAVELIFASRNLAIWGRTLLLCTAVTLSSAVISVPLAWLLTRTNLPGRKFWGITAALPLVMPSYIFAYLFVSLFGPKGMLQQALAPFGVERLPELYGFWGAWLVLTLISYPYTYLTVRAGIRQLDPCQIEAARSLGLNFRQAFWRVVLPQLRPAIVAGSLLVALYTLRDFGAVHLLRYSTFTRAIYLQYQSLFDRSLAAALALQLVLLTAVILYFEWRSRGRARYARTSVGVAREAQPLELGRWQWPALLFVGSLSTLGVFIPAGALVYWVVRGLRQDWGVRAVAGMPNVVDPLALWQPAFNSLSVSLLAAGLTVFLALPVAILAVRRRGGLAQFVEQFTYSGFALPGIVIALAMVYFGANYAPTLYQTLPMLLVAYAILFIPQAVGSIRASLLQVPANLEAAGRSLGKRPSAVFRQITLPLVSPGIMAGGAMVFLTCMKELPATLLLSPTGFNTLPQAVWSNISEAFFAQAALPTLLLILLSSVPLAWLNGRE